MYQEMGQNDFAIDCLKEALNRSVLMYGANSVRASNSYQTLAMQYFDNDDFKNALDYQDKSISILETVRVCYGD